MSKINYPTEEQVRARAYQLFLERGGRHGHDADDWLQAEYELVQLPVQKIAELDTTPPKRKEKRKLALVNLVQAAMLLGAEALPHLKA
jgi:hypothetical protein